MTATPTGGSGIACDLDASVTANRGVACRHQLRNVPARWSARQMTHPLNDRSSSLDASVLGKLPLLMMALAAVGLVSRGKSAVLPWIARIRSARRAHTCL